MDTGHILAHFEHVRPAGADRWTATCPAHADKSPSLSIRRAGDKLLVFCHAGCTFSAVTASAGLAPGDLFADDRERRRPGPRIGGFAPVQRPPSPAVTAEDLAAVTARATYATMRPLITGEAIAPGDAGAWYAEARGLASLVLHLAGARWTPSLPVLALDSDKRPVAGPDGTWRTRRCGRAAIVFPLRNLAGELVAWQARFFSGEGLKHYSAGRKGAGVFTTPGGLDTRDILLHEAPLKAGATATCGFASVGLAGLTWPDWLPARIGSRRVFVALDDDAAGERKVADLAQALAPFGGQVFRLRPGGGAKDFDEALAARGPAQLERELAAVIAPGRRPCCGHLASTWQARMAAAKERLAEYLSTR